MESPARVTARNSGARSNLRGASLCQPTERFFRDSAVPQLDSFFVERQPPPITHDDAVLSLLFRDRNLFQILRITIEPSRYRHHHFAGERKYSRHLLDHQASFINRY